MCVKVFQDIHNSKSLDEEGVKKREETLKEEEWKLNYDGEDNSSYNVFFSMKELKEAVHAGANTTPGQDKISYEMLKHLADPSCPSSYRPIALTTVPCKMMKRMVTNRLVYILETSKFFVDYQYGFRKGRSTVDSIPVLDQDIRRAIFNTKQYWQCS